MTDEDDRQRYVEQHRAERRARQASIALAVLLLGMAVAVAVRLVVR